MKGVFVPNSQSATSFLLALVSSFAPLLTPGFTHLKMQNTASHEYVDEGSHKTAASTIFDQYSNK